MSVYVSDVSLSVSHLTLLVTSYIIVPVPLLLYSQAGISQLFVISNVSSHPPVASFGVPPATSPSLVHLTTLFLHSVIPSLQCTDDTQVFTSCYTCQQDYLYKSCDIIITELVTRSGHGGRLSGTKTHFLLLDQHRDLVWGCVGLCWPGASTKHSLVSGSGD